MLEHIGKSVWSWVLLLWAVSSLSCQLWQRGSDSDPESSIHRTEVRYEANVLPEENDPPFVPEAECGVQSITAGILNIEDNVSGGGPESSRCKFYSRNDPLASPDDAEMEIRVRVRPVDSQGGSRSVQAGFLDGTKIILLGLSTTSVQFMARHGIEIPGSRVYLDTTVFHTYKIAKHGDDSVDILVDGELKIRLPYASLSDYSQDAPKQAFGAGSNWGTSNSDWDFVNYTISRRPPQDDSQESDTLDVSQNRLQQDDREPRYLTDKSATNLRRPRFVLMDEIRFDPPEGVALHMHDPVIGRDSFYLLNSRHTVSEFGRDGRFIRNIGEKLRNQLELGHIFSFAVDPQDDRIYVSGDDDITIFNPDGSFERRIELPAEIYPSELNFGHNGDLLFGLRTNDSLWLGIHNKEGRFTFFCEERRKLLGFDEEFRRNFIPRFHTLTDTNSNIYAINRVDYEIRKYDHDGVYVGDFKIQKDQHYRPPPDGVDKSLLWTDPEFSENWYSTWTAVTGSAIANGRYLIAALGSLSAADQKVRLHFYDLEGRKAFQQIEWEEHLVGNDSEGDLYFYSRPADAFRVYALETTYSPDKSKHAHLLKKKRGNGGGKAYQETRKVETEAAPAPAFSVTSLDGEDLNSRSLRGKVAVLNFWFIGCAPCRIEIPSLNKLVDEFDQDDVVFIAFARDGEAPLRSFLKELPFKYKIIPAAADVISKFNVSTYPTHIVIDQKGNIDTVLFGGGENRHEDLQPLIERLLQAES